jgi:ABC-type branched-subunit amino acid transport system ATPase component
MTNGGPAVTRNPNARPIFEAKGLAKTFGGIVAVRDVSFAVAEGEILGIAGPNGSGKSTLFNIITNVPFAADGGETLFRGADIRHWPGHRIAREGLARTFQRESVFAGLSAIDNVMVAVEAHASGAGLKTRERVAEEALDIAGYPATMHNMIAGALPVFYRKLVMIAAAIALKPVLLLLDEPASSLTPPEIERIRGLILKLRESGMTILLIEHVLSLLTSVSDRLMVLDQGSVIAEGTPSRVIADPRVVEAYLGGTA